MSTKKWTFEKCKIAALEFTNKTLFIKKYSKAYSTAKENNWIDDICSHMIQINK